MYRQKAIIVDTTAFIAGFNIYSVHGEVYSVPEVAKELIGDSISKLRLKMAIEDGRLKLGRHRLRRVIFSPSLKPI